ncbi:hypothetical protein P4475_14925, partial [Halalkalibacterium halodurans]|uniref:hypothetical protein n=1 Tax=Halalkalibacterium halodurans TaxID=86665 RepID=UPI002E202ACA|nr:hypothetical protein [Halalkalibacterium halodurans]
KRLTQSIGSSHWTYRAFSIILKIDLTSTDTAPLLRKGAFYTWGATTFSTTPLALPKGFG